MSHRYCGRDFQADEIALIRQLIAEDPARTRAELSPFLPPMPLYYRGFHCADPAISRLTIMGFNLGLSIRS